MYITTLNPKIVKTTPNFELLHEVDTGECHIGGIEVVGDELMVCTGNGVAVYTKDLQYVRHIGSRGADTAASNYDLSSDHHGNVYVSNFREGCVQVFSNSGGKFLHSFGVGNSPSGLCVAGEYVYVTSSVLDTVSAYTLQGEHVTSFGQHGSDHGDFNNPHGVCVDEEGFVYVCDTHNNRLQKF